MTYPPSRFGALFLVLAAGCGLGALFPGQDQGGVFVASAIAQTAETPPNAAPATSASPAAMDPAMSAEIVHTDKKTRHLAPHDTFYLLDYVSAKTDKGVEGFEPGQEVHLVEVHHPTHTLVVTDGRAQVEVPPSKLTNDRDIAALVRQKDQASQAQLAAYIQTEQEAHDKFEREAAEATAKDIADRKEERREEVAEVRAAEQAKAEQRQPVAQPASAPAAGNGYYDEGGYGYGSPFAYVVTGSSSAASTAPAPAAPAAPPANAAAPAAHAAVGGRPK